MRRDDAINAKGLQEFEREPRMAIFLQLSCRVVHFLYGSTDIATENQSTDGRIIDISSVLRIFFNDDFYIEMVAVSGFKSPSKCTQEVF